MTAITLLASGILAVISCTCTAAENEINEKKLITDCCKLSNFYFTFGRGGNETSGLYMLDNFCGYEHMKAVAYCDTINGGGGWLVVQRRQDGSNDFNRGWGEYEDGFGKLNGEFWYGLKALHCLTSQDGWEMRMDIKLANGTNIFFQYEQFKVASAKDKYKLTVGGFQGTTSDPVSEYSGMYFTTKDNDNDIWSTGNCAINNWNNIKTGGWWYKLCTSIQINTQYNHSSAIYLNNEWHSLPFTEMKIRPHNCNI